MGIILKVIGGLTIFGWIVMAVGCTMLSHAISQAGGAAAIHQATDRAAITRALQDGDIDTDGLPSGSALMSSEPVTVRLRDGTTRALGTTPQDRLIRTLLVQRRMERIDGSSSPYDGGGDAYHGSASQPHFKPGEPMVNPNPSGSYDD